MIDKNYIGKEFIELHKIENKTLKEGVIKVWVLGCERGGWKRIDDIPFTLLIPTKISLIEHTRRVTQMAISITEVRDDLDRDILIAGALTHDVGKLLEYTRKGNKVIKSEFGIRVRHPISGYELALRVGLSRKVAHIIAAHSHEGDKIERSPEAIVVHHCDFIEFEIAKGK